MTVNNDVEKTIDDTEKPTTGITQARFDFDARFKRKKSKWNVKTVGMMVGLIVGLITAIVIIIMIAASHMHRNNQVDESRVQADAAFERRKGKDSSMVNLLKSKEKEQSTVETPPEGSTGSKLPVPNASNPSSGSSNTDTSVDVAPVEDGGIFPTVQRFESSGLSAGSVGAVSGGQYDDPDIEKIKAFANAPSPVSHGINDEAGAITETNRRRLSNLGGTGFVPSKAHVMPSRKFLVTHNTYTRCALYTEIVTDQPGLIECRLTEPLCSADGSVVITYAGDKRTGEQKVEVRAGQTRVFTSWTELETVSGVRAQLNSLWAGPMEASGTEAWINNHYMQRFCRAVMLSLQKGGNGYTVNNSQKNVETMANKALKNSINIPSMAYILPGTVMTVIVARDINFSSVFKIR